MAYADAELGPGVNALGFGPDRGIHWGGLDPFPGHGPRDVVVNTLLNITAIDVELFGWAIGSTLPLALLLALGRFQRNDYWLMGWVAAIVAWHALYWYSGGPDFGARYWYLAIVPLAALAARALLELSGVADEASGSSPSAGSLVIAGAVLLSLVAMLDFVPWRALDKYHHYRGMRADVREMLSSQDFENALLLIRGERHPDYASAIVYTGLDPDGDEPMIAWDRSDSVREALRRAYPDRPTWTVDGPSITGDGYHITGGPLPGRQQSLPGWQESLRESAPGM
jgi:hypothetical protein